MSRKAYHRAWHLAHREEQLKQFRLWYAANKEQHKARTRARYLADPEKKRAAVAAYRATAAGMLTAVRSQAKERKSI